MVVARQARFIEGAYLGGRSRARSAPRFRAGSGALADRARFLRRIEKPLYRLRQFSRMRDFNRSAGRAEILGDGAEVFHMWARDHWLAKERRFQNVVPAGVYQRAAHEDDIGE